MEKEERKLFKKKNLVAVRDGGGEGGGRRGGGRGSIPTHLKKVR